MPPGSHVAELKIEPLNESINKTTLDGNDFLACPKTKGSHAYQVFSAAAKDIKPPSGNKDDCLGFTAVAESVDAQKFLTWEYN